MTDITDIQPVENRPVEIVHPRTEEHVGLTVYMRPRSHPEVSKVRRRQQNKQLNSRSNRLTAEQIEAQGLEMIVASVSDWAWHGELTLNGEQPEYSDERLRELMKKADFVRTQLDAELGDEGAFYEG